MATANLSPSHAPGAHVQSGAVLRTRLGALTRRRNAQQMVRHIVRAAIPAVALSAVGIALYRFHIIPDGPVWAPAVLIGASVIWGARNGWMARRGHFAAASDADKTLDLDDRLSSALAFVAPDEIRRTQKVAAKTGKLGRIQSVLLPRTVSTSAVASPETNLVPALVGDASARAASLDPRRVYPFRFDRSAQILTLCGLLLVGACFLPDVPLLMNQGQKAERAAIVKEGEKLIAVSKEIRKEEKPNEVEVAKLNNKLEKLGKKMARGRLTKRAALTEIGELKKKLEDSQKPGNQTQSGGLPQIPEALKQTPLQSEVGRRVQKAIQDNKMDEAAKELDKLADRLDKGQVSQKEKEQVASDLDKVAKDLENRGGQANQDAAQKLKDAANQLRQAPQNPPQLNPQDQQGQQNQGNPGQQNQQQNGQKQQGQQGQDQQKQNQQGQQQQGQQGQQNQSKQGQGQQQGQQGGQQQQKQGQQGQQGGQQQGGQQQGKQGQKQQGGQGQSPQNQAKQGQQSQGSQGQSPQGQGKQGQQGSQGQSPQGQGKQGQQSQGSQGQSPQGQGQQGQQGSQGQGQQPGQGKQGQQGGQGGQSGQGQQGQGSGASGAMRDMANSLRQGSGSGGSGSTREMLDKLREAENGASGQGNMSGQPGGNSAGGRTFGSKGEMGNMITPGKDLKPTDPHGFTGGGPGLGPRNNSQGVNSGGGVSKKKSTRTGDKRRYADAWSAQLPSTQKNISKIKGKWGGGGEVEQLPTKGEAKGGQAQTPLYDTYQSYKKDAEDAVSRETVPPAYKQPVKDYFESIKP